MLCDCIQVNTDTVQNRKKKSAELRKDISTSSNMHQIRKFSVAIPDIRSHKGHVITKVSFFHFSFTYLYKN